MALLAQPDAPIFEIRLDFGHWSPSEIRTIASNRNNHGFSTQNTGADAVLLTVLASLTITTGIFLLVMCFRPTPVKHQAVSPEQLIKSGKRRKRTKIIFISAIVFVFSLYALVFGGLNFFLW
jgi:hypothetical protein